MEFSRLKILVISFCLVLTVISATALQIAADYRDTLSQQETSMADMTHVVKLHIDDTIRLTDVTLKQMERLVRAEPVLSRFRSASLEQMTALCEALNGCVNITVVDPAGMVVARSTKNTKPGVDVSERAYFQHGLSNDQLYVAPAVVTKMPGNPILFAISKPVKDKNGRLIAILAAHLSTSHLTDFYGLMGFNLDPTVVIFKSDSSIVARHPDMEQHVGKTNPNSPLFKVHLARAPSGVYRSLSPLDGKERISAYQLLKDWDLLIVCGTEISTAMASWKNRSLWTAGTAALGLALIFMILFWGYRSLTQQQSLIKKNSELNRLSNIDPLTGIANRRVFDAVLLREWNAYRQTGKNLSLLLIDVDHFKKFNDYYGHPEGDRCLRRIATALQAALLRKDDLVARYGGEEFGVILNSDECGARDVAARMRNAVQALQIPHAPLSPTAQVTISIGLADAPGCDAHSMEALLAHADSALYQAKADGRTRVAQHTVEFTD
ncbi:MAG: sensor domain-containing diguanylate cyclase [Burkholderiaceae bacterium]